MLNREETQKCKKVQRDKHRQPRGMGNSFEITLLKGIKDGHLIIIDPKKELK